METTKIIQILKEVDINLFLKPNTCKAVLADLLYDYKTEQKILNTVNNSVNVVEKLYKSKNVLIDFQSIKSDLLSYGLNDETVEWALDIWLGVLGLKTKEPQDTNDLGIKMSSGGSFTISIIEENRVFAWGNNKWGQLGTGNFEDSKRPVEITDQFSLNSNESIKSVFTSFRSSYLLTTKGSIYAFGNNQYGQLGDGSNDNHNRPFNISNQFNLLFNEEIQTLKSGGFHTLLTTSFNRVLAFGNNEYGQLGHGTKENKNRPIDISKHFKLSNDEKVVHVSAGLGHSMLTTSLGRVFSWGNNEYGQLGDGSTIKKNRPTDITGQLNLMDTEEIQSISLGGLHSLVVTTKGRVFAFGNNEHGQLGDSTLDSRMIPIEITKFFNSLEHEQIIDVKAGRNFSLALTSGGRVFSWGNNQNGQLGIDSFITGTKGPIDITSKIINHENEWVVNINTGASAMHSYAISSKGTVYAWGSNDYGQIGEGSTDDKRSAIELKIV